MYHVEYFHKMWMRYGLLFLRYKSEQDGLTNRQTAMRMRPIREGESN